MTTRRTIILSIAGTAAAIPVLRAIASQAVFPGPVTVETPKASVIKGHPPVLDFGDGLRIPCNKSAFLTLWEGPHFWLTFGAGRATYRQAAQGQAVKYANGAMKLLLMTLAFAPERLVRENGGWRLKVQDMRRYVKGELLLPGLPYWPITDAEFAVDGFAGSRDLDNPGLLAPPAGGGLTAPGWDPATSSNDKVDAYTTYIVLKRDVSLDDVRRNAQILIE